MRVWGKGRRFGEFFGSGIGKREKEKFGNFCGRVGVGSRENGKIWWFLAMVGQGTGQRENFRGFFVGIGNGEIWDREKGTGRMGRF